MHFAASAALAISLVSVLWTIHRHRDESLYCPGGSSFNSYSFRGGDYPTWLPLRLPLVQTQFEDSKHYGLANPEAWAEYRSLYYFPRGDGYVKLGSENRTFLVSMFHELHCLEWVRDAVIKDRAEVDAEHTHHCLNFLRQRILCAADTSLYPVNADGSVETHEKEHVCRDFGLLYRYVWENGQQGAWGNSSRTVLSNPTKVGGIGKFFDGDLEMQQESANSGRTG